MTQNQLTAQPAASTSAASWDLRHPGCIMRGANGEEIHEFLGMWPLKPDADLEGLANALSREAPSSLCRNRFQPGGPSLSGSDMTVCRTFSYRNRKKVSLQD